MPGMANMYRRDGIGWGRVLCKHQQQRTQPLPFGVRKAARYTRSRASE